MRKILYFMMITCCMATALFCLGSCDSDLDIQQEYPFTVETMPVADKIKNGETVEIRLEILSDGDFNGTVYTLRYFQPSGDGLLKMEDGTVLKPNDRYLFENEKFCLYYTSESREVQSFIVVVEDNNNQSYETEFSFNNENRKEEKGGRND